jgi:hypothetical protein
MLKITRKKCVNYSYFSEKKNILKNTIHTYQRGLIVGTGAFTALSIMTYLFRHPIKKGGYNTATDILQNNNVKVQASLFSTDIVDYILKNPLVYEWLINLALKLLDDPTIQQKFTDIMASCAIDALKKEEFQKEVTSTLKASLKRMIW